MALLDGSPISADDLKSLALVNYGHFTSMRVDDQHIRGLSHHMDRLVKDCKEVFGAELDREHVRELVRQAVGDTAGSFVVRVTVFDPALELGHPGVSSKPHVLITTRSATAWPPAPMRAKTAHYVRDLPLVKHIGLFGAIRHRRLAQLAGFDDALLTDGNGYFSEGATWNVGFFDGDNVIWPDAEVLPGVTMRLLQQVHEKTVTAPVNISELPNIQAAFATNTTVGVRPITKINDYDFPEDHDIFRTLRSEYEEIPAEQI